MRRRRKFKKGRDDDKIIVTFQTDGETTSYTGRYEELEFKGVTVGNENDVREVLARMLTADKEPPESMASLLSLVASYVELIANMGVKYVTTSAGVEFREDGEVGVGVDIFYVEGGGDDAYKVESQEGLKRA
jgi:hypothetical protein